MDESLTKCEFLFWCFAVFCLKGWNICPSTTSLRTIYVASMFIGVIYYVFYCASLVSTLAIVFVPIKTISELGASGLTILGDFWLPNNHEIVKGIVEGNAQPGLSEEDRYIPIDKAIPRLLSSASAYVTFYDGFRTAFHRHNYTDRFYCETFSSLNPMKAPVTSGMFIQKGSPLKELINPK